MLVDQHKRDEFTKNLAQNFSVIASPGTGKTTAITDRIGNLVLSEASLKNFIAVTYTDKAAKEIKERVYGKILTDKTVSEVTLKNLEGIFFGTIHGFCAKFLREHYGKAHLNKDFEIIGDDRDLWHKFTSQINKIIDKIVPIGLRDCLANHFKLGEILRQAREVTAPTTCGEKFVPPPMEDIAEILAYEASASEDKIYDFQKNVKLWMNSKGTCSFPEIPKVGGQNFSKHCSEKIQTYLRWKSEMECYLTNKISEEYVAFKIAHNSLGYNELTNLTLKILADKEYREKYVQDYTIILDEAQDTDEIQFKILLNLISYDLYEKIFGPGELDTFKGGSFSLVGDPKQSIYADRADVEFYIFLHNKLLEKKFLKQLNFNVTMRCSRRIVEFVNAKFEHAFMSSSIKFIPMCAKPGSKQGRIEILRGESGKILVEIFSNKTCSDFGVESFSEVCILAPRKSWLSELAKSCKGDDTLPRMQLGFDENLENFPSILKWTASIMHFLNNICDHRELAGTLREIFGINTREIIKFFNHNDSTICESICDKFITLKQEQRHLSLPSFIRKTMDNFHLVPRIKSLNIFTDEEINTHYESIMDASYQTNLSCDELERKLINLYKNPQAPSMTDKNSIQLLSFHKSKGLEWPVVILPFMYRERKLMGSKLGKNALENERRMLFVACTRARERLILVNDSEYHTKSHRINMISSASLLGY